MTTIESAFGSLLYSLLKRSWLTIKENYHKKVAGYIKKAIMFPNSIPRLPPYPTIQGISAIRMLPPMTAPMIAAVEQQRALQKARPAGFEGGEPPFPAPPPLNVPGIPPANLRDFLVQNDQRQGLPQALGNLAANRVINNKIEPNTNILNTNIPQSIISSIPTGKLPNQRLLS